MSDNNTTSGLILITLLRDAKGLLDMCEKPERSVTPGNRDVFSLV